MDGKDQLVILKKDLQMLTAANDDYLKNLLKLSKAKIEKEGIKLGKDIESGMLQVQYAAYLFRARAGAQTEMPRFLRYGLNNMLFSQKAGGKK